MYLYLASFATSRVMNIWTAPDISLWKQRKRDEDYLCLVSERAESLRAMDNGPTIFNT